MAKRAAKELVFLGNGVGEYELEDLLCSYAEVLARGTFGTTYKTDLELKSIKKAVAVKRLKGERLPEMKFKEKIEELGNMLHENLLSIRAYYCSDDERLLIYDYMNMGSLAFFLHGNGVATKTPLTWEVRCTIAYGVACGIAYMHTQGSNVCHGNLRSSNVLLTNSFDARISDFCIAQLVPFNCKANLTEGYRAPEVINPHAVSKKSDVYSFGVLLLELLTGKDPRGVLPEGLNLPKWVRSMFQEKPIIDVFDAMLRKYDNNIGEQMVQLLQLAVCCTFQNPTKRPSMTAVANRIKRICRYN